MARAIDIEALLVWSFRDQKVETTRNPPEDALTVYWAVMALPEPYGSMVRQVARDGYRTYQRYLAMPRDAQLRFIAEHTGRTA